VHQVKLGYLLRVIALALCCGAPVGTASAAWNTDAATVEIADVYYTLPSFWNVALIPRDPLCRHFENFDMVIVGRELFINGILAYQAKRFDKVFVAYPEGPAVNGRLVHARRYQLLDDSIHLACSYSD
jgi:hypothetical protein